MLDRVAFDKCKAEKLAQFLSVELRLLIMVGAGGELADAEFLSIGTVLLCLCFIGTFVVPGQALMVFDQLLKLGALGLPILALARRAGVALLTAVPASLKILDRHRAGPAGAT